MNGKLLKALSGAAFAAALVFLNAAVLTACTDAAGDRLENPSLILHEQADRIDTASGE